jgi:MFS family permease
VRRREVLLLYLVLFVGEISWQGAIPLIPSYVTRYGLSDAQGGLILGISSLGILLVSLPAGVMTRRWPPRTLSLLAMAVIAMTTAGMGVIDAFAPLLIARFLFGLGVGVLWVTIPAWVSDAAGEAQARALAGVTVIAGMAGLVGPAYAGWVAQRLGLQAPFLGIAVASVVLLVVMALDRSGTGRRLEPSPAFRAMLRATHADPGLSTMLLLTTAAALLWATADLLVPLRLDRAGFDVGALGTLFAVSSVLFVGASAATARRADRWARTPVAVGASLALAGATALPALAIGVPATVVFLLVASLATGVTVALTYPFGLVAVERGVVSVAVMSAMANMIWALTGLVGPLLGGATAQAAGDQVAFAGLAAVCVLVTVLVGRQRVVHASGTAT